MDSRIVVVGAGMVGVCCALELRRRGLPVTLVDRGEPGGETSSGNAGVLTRSSLVPLNNPGLWRTLPALLRHRSPSLRWRAGWALRHLPWALRFVANARAAPSDATSRALDALIRASIPEHRRLLDEAGIGHRLRDTGWLQLFRSEAAWAAAAGTRAVHARFGIRTEALGPDDIAALEPALSRVFAHGLWVRDAASVDDPAAVVAAYAARFASIGGQVRRASVDAIEPAAGGWTLVAGGERWPAARVVVAAGPWSARLLAPLGVRVPLVAERGYHRHFALRGDVALGRPIHDTGGGYVLSPMARGLRLTTGVELDEIDAPPRTEQLELAERAAREVAPLGESLQPQPWLGRRPTLPDSRPMIGALPGRAGLWLAFGHQHIGFCTGAGTGLLLGALITGDPPPFDAAPFAPGRYITA